MSGRSFAFLEACREQMCLAGRDGYGRVVSGGRRGEGLEVANEPLAVRFLGVGPSGDGAGDGAGRFRIRYAFGALPDGGATAVVKWKCGGRGGSLLICWSIGLNLWVAWSIPVQRTLETALRPPLRKAVS